MRSRAAVPGVRLPPKHRGHQFADPGNDRPPAERLPFQGLERCEHPPRRDPEGHSVDRSDSDSSVGWAQHKDGGPCDPPVFPAVIEIPRPHHFPFRVAEEFEWEIEVAFVPGGTLRWINGERVEIRPRLHEVVVPIAIRG